MTRGEVQQRVPATPSRYSTRVRWSLALLFLASVALPAPLAAAPVAQWQVVSGGANLAAPVFWEAFPGAQVSGGVVSIDGRADSALVLDRWGPRLTVAGDFRLVATLQASAPGVARLALVDEQSEARRVELGLDRGQLAIGFFDDADDQPSAWQTFPVADALGPLTVTLAREGQEYALQLSGAEVARFDDPGVFPTDQALLGARVGDGIQLRVYALDVEAPAERPVAVRVERCAPDRLLIAGSEVPNAPARMWWAWPDGGLLRPIEVHDANQRMYLVAVSPDGRWVSYYQRSSQAPADRFVVDTWVIDVATDQRIRLVEGQSPVAWTADSGALVLSQQPAFMVTVPKGEIVPTEGQVVIADSMRATTSPDGRYRAGIASMPTGAAGVNILDVQSGELVMTAPTGRAAPQLAWSPDSTRLAFTSGADSSDGIVWRLRIVDVAERSVALIEDTRDMEIHSVLWVRARGPCA